MWALLNYSLLTNREGDIIKNNMVQAIKSAASIYYTLDMQMAFSQQVLRDSQRRGQVMQRVSPRDEIGTTFYAKGMAHRIETETKQSWAVSHAHIAYVDGHLEEAYSKATTDDNCHKLACAGSANLMAYLVWL
jgi:hypothetical protein